MEKFEVAGGAQGRVGGEGVQAVHGGGEAVHEEEAGDGAAAGGAAEVEDLAGDEVEKAESVADGEEAFGLVEAHARAEAAVEFDDQGALQQGSEDFAWRGR